MYGVVIKYTGVVIKYTNKKSHNLECRKMHNNKDIYMCQPCHTGHTNTV